MRVIRVPVEPLTEEAFAPFGEVIHSFEEKHPEVVKGGLRRKEIAISSTERRHAHFAYHTDAGQSFYPSRHRPCVFMVAPISESIRPEDIRAFKSAGNLGVCLKAGVWHTFPICLEGEEVFQSERGDQDYAAHSVEVDFDVEQGVILEPDW